MNSNPGQFDLFVMARDFSVSPEENGICLLKTKESIIEKGNKSEFSIKELNNFPSKTIVFMIFRNRLSKS